MLTYADMQHPHHIARLVHSSVVCVARQQHAALLDLITALLTLTARLAAFTYILLLYLLLYCFNDTYGTRVRRCPHPELRISARKQQHVSMRARTWIFFLLGGKAIVQG